MRWHADDHFYPLRSSDRLERNEPVDQPLGIDIDDEACAMSGGQELLGDHVIDEAHEGLMEALKIEQPNGLSKLA
jgi:hypothetical protein